jgi:hypothetical protein
MSWLDAQGSSAGIGRADIDRALAAGRTAREIQEELNRAKAAGIAVGEKALSWSAPSNQRFDLQEAVQANQDYENQITSLEKFNQAGYGSFGASALERARASGMSDQDIRSGIERGRYTIGEKAYQDLYASEPTVGGGFRPFRNKYGKVGGAMGEYADQGDVADWDRNVFQSFFGSQEPSEAPRIEDKAVEEAYDRNKVQSYLQWLQKTKSNPQAFLERYVNTGF